MEFNKPFVLEETPDFAVVYKPPGIHCAPLGEDAKNTLLYWYASCATAKYPDMETAPVHRLDHDTHGLVLFANNRDALDHFKRQQKEGSFVKEYSAKCGKEKCILPGFPPRLTNDDGEDKTFAIKSFFRPYGPGRKQVRPVIDPGKKRRETAKDNGAFYRTEVLGVKGDLFILRIYRGFRHQIRCHLCWIGRPILGDSLYGAHETTQENLALRAHALFFNDPKTGERREYRIPALE
jgi:23S rRNA pseudouridine1911/1915/1917 synthase